ncbi:hypothetical protein IMG5_007480, partial [Ichthyophthirius multifiliis]
MVDYMKEIGKMIQNMEGYYLYQNKKLNKKRGYEKFQNGSYYEGQYINGKPEGIGRYTSYNKETYDGQWVNGMKHGNGIWRGNNKDSYVGEWKYGKADGQGVHIWNN